MGKTESSLQQKEAEIDRIQGVLAEQDERLAQLEEAIRQTGETIAASLYSAIKGDLVDELLAKYINLTQCPVPIKRLGNGYYLFGTKKIFAKIMNGKLVIRVGGGFMVIEEFIASYAEQEMKKIQMMELAQMSSDGEATNKSKGYSSLNKKSPRAQHASPRTDAQRKK
jgi:prefoldin subunit 5